MNELTQYIKQRIEYYDNNRFSYEMDSQLCNCVISELQAVLSKIEDLEKELYYEFRADPIQLARVLILAVPEDISKVVINTKETQYSVRIDNK